MYFDNWKFKNYTDKIIVVVGFLILVLIMIFYTSVTTSSGAASLPTPGDSDGTWGTELNTWLRVAHDANGDANSIANSILLLTVTSISELNDVNVAGTFHYYKDPNTGHATALYIDVNDGNAVYHKQVYIGDASSAGAGYRTLRITN